MIIEPYSATNVLVTNSSGNSSRTSHSSTGLVPKTNTAAMCILLR
jgi:hypothetical protein